MHAHLTSLCFCFTSLLFFHMGWLVVPFVISPLTHIHTHYWFFQACWIERFLNHMESSISWIHEK